MLLVYLLIVSRKVCNKQTVVGIKVSPSKGSGIKYN
jgi:hypothetical protein